MSDLRIAPITIDELGSIDTALRTELQAMLGAEPSTEVSTLLGAYRDKRLVGAVYHRLQSGRVATVWVPRTIAPEPLQTAVSLLQASLEQIAQGEVDLVQSLLEINAVADFDTLQSVGFRHVADLLYLACPLEQDAKSEISELKFVPYHPELHNRFARIVEATYEGSLDCPEVDGIREMNDVFAGYRATGIYSPDRWLIVTEQGIDVGCLILTEYEGQGTWELVYMGLLPAARGKALGLSIVEHAKRLALTARQTRVVLAVDANNEPALRMYAQAGFTAWTQRSVMIVATKNFSELETLEQR